MDDLFSNLVLTTLQVADLTGRTPDTVRRWVRLGKVPVERRGHSTGIPAELVAAMLAARPVRKGRRGGDGVH